MTNIAVKGAGSLLDVSMAAKNSIQSDNGAENFDETLNGIRTERTDKSKKNACVYSKNSEDGKTERFEAVNRKNQVKPEEEITDEQIAAVSEEVISQMKEMLMEKYNISEEQLKTTIEGLGLSEDSILNVTELTQIVMKLEGIENQADMLTNSEFAKNLKEILMQLEDIKANVKPEDFQFEKLDVGTESAVAKKDTHSMEEVHIDNASNGNIEDETATVETDDVAKDVQPVENITTDTSSANQNDSSDGMHNRDDKKNSFIEVKNTDVNANTVQPQDFVQKLTEDLTNKVGETQANDIVRQVVNQTQLQVKQGITSLEMQLYPEHLGKVLVQVVSNEGSITAQITAESEAAKVALESQLTLLKENLNNQGVKVENVEVTIASHAFEQNMQGEANGEQNSSQSRRSRRNTDMFFDTVGDEQIEEVDQTIMELKGSTVSYSA